MEITKTDGTSEAFKPAKLCLSIRKSGAPRALAEEACRTIETKVTPNDSTSAIYRKTLRYLMKEAPAVAARYSLRRGLEALGPGGFIFEQYFETVLQAYGFRTKRNVILKGKCITHETDVIAETGSKRFLIEAKYHNVPGLKTHVDVVMYADARLQDIVAAEKTSGKNKFEYGMWIVTNTKFTDASIKYAQCRGIRLTGWNYPRGASLEDVIADKKLYPVTVLPSVPKLLLPEFAKRDIILAQDLLTYEAADLARTFKIDRALAEALVSEVAAITK